MSDIVKKGMSENIIEVDQYRKRELQGEIYILNLKKFKYKKLESNISALVNNLEQLSESLVNTGEYLGQALVVENIALGVESMTAEAEVIKGYSSVLNSCIDELNINIGKIEDEINKRTYQLSNL